MKPISRSAGRSVIAAAAYRLGERLHEVETDQMHDYTRRHGVTATFTCTPGTAPAWAHDSERLWNAAAAAETRKNSTLAREIELALPAAVTPEARAGIVRAMAQELASRYGVAATAAIHAPGRNGDQRNHHAHILFTTRRLEAEGFGQKTRVLDDRKTGPQEIIYLRAFAADLINAALADAGSDERVDHRSFAARGIEQEATRHLGPTASALERKGRGTERGDANREVTGGNQRLDALVDELAALDAQIAAEQERELDARYGPADDEPLPGLSATLAPAAADLALAQAADLPPVEAGEHARAASDLTTSVTPATEPASDHVPDDRATVELTPPIDPGLAMFLPPASSPDTESDFESVHNRTIIQAAADLAIIQAEEAGDAGSGFSRFLAWWNNLHAHFVEWREYLQERFAHYLPQWEREPDRDDDREHEP